ncbi:zinc ribbon domain-containing protein [Azotosporobacter soli]|uniref:zinc ribbon domain-containing protein n=1 Tax=Azotosporobacter soli TaxID=3055040 RepID=UPI0031FEC481
MWMIIILAAGYLYYTRKQAKERAAQMKRKPTEDYIEAEAKVVVEIPCSQCGKLVEDDFRHCPYCGQKIK